MAERVAARKRDDLLARGFSPDGPAASLGALRNGATWVLAALTPSDCAELAVERGGMVQVGGSCSGCGYWQSKPGRCRSCGKTIAFKTPLYRKADEGDKPDADN